MESTKQSLAMKSYGREAVHSEIEYASPHRLIQMLMEGALEKIAFAKGSLARGDFAAKGKHIGWAISIINGLRFSLDKAKGGQVAENLDAIYDYMVRCLTEANSLSTPEKLDEATALMLEIKTGWDSIPEQYRYGVPHDTAMR